MKWCVPLCHVDKAQQWHVCSARRRPRAALELGPFIPQQQTCGDRIGLSVPCQTRTCPVGARLRTKTSGYCDLRTDPKLIFGLRKPIAIHAEISLNMNLPE